LTDLERLAKFTDKGEEEGAGKSLSLGIRASAVFEQGEAEVLLEGRDKALRAAEYRPAVLQQHLEQLQREHLSADGHRVCPLPGI
jgi:hypothetical protein